MHVTAAASAASDWAASERRSRWNRPTSSSAKCCASTELPPLPNVYRRPSRSYVSISRRATSSTCGRSASTRPARARWSARAAAASLMRDDVAGRPFVDDRRRADDADVVSESRLHDLRGGRSRLHRVGSDPLTHGAEQLLARARDTAAEHDELGLEQVHDRGEPA